MNPKRTAEAVRFCVIKGHWEGRGETIVTICNQEKVDWEEKMRIRRRVTKTLRIGKSGEKT